MARHERHLFFGTLALGDVVMGDNPAATRQRLLHRVDRAPVRGLDQLSGRLSSGDRFQDLIAVLLRIALEQPDVLAMLNEGLQPAAGLHHVA